MATSRAKKANRPAAKNSLSGKAPIVSRRESIAIHGARVHNLKNISIEIPRDRLVVVTGLSG
jgi:excinuclease ABC subunit A